jgi:hypothetical protein
MRREQRGHARAQRELCPQSKEFYREGAQRGVSPQPKEFYREDAKDAKLREAKINSCFLL